MQSDHTTTVQKLERLRSHDFTDDGRHNKAWTLHFISVIIVKITCINVILYICI